MNQPSDLAPDDDPIVAFSLHESTLRLLHGLLRALADLSEPGGERLTPDVLAGELGVAPISLYHYVRDKDDLLDEVVDRMLSRVWQPDADEGDWLAWVVEAATRLREFLIDQPAALRVYLLHPPLSPAASARMTAMLGVLQRGGLDEEKAHRAFGAVQVYTVGFAALEASRARWLSTHTSSDPLFQELAALTSPRQFAEGLGYLLEGIERRATPERDGTLV